MKIEGEDSVTPTTLGILIGLAFVVVIAMWVFW